MAAAKLMKKEENTLKDAYQLSKVLWPLHPGNVPLPSADEHNMKTPKRMTSSMPYTLQQRRRYNLLLNLHFYLAAIAFDTCNYKFIHYRSILLKESVPGNSYGECQVGFAVEMRPEMGPEIGGFSNLRICKLYSIRVSKSALIWAVNLSLHSCYFQSLGHRKDGEMIKFDLAVTYATTLMAAEAKGAKCDHLASIVSSAEMSS
ncbi:hypothetical protein Tco_1244386 [Tanacetum coccineum]